MENVCVFTESKRQACYYKTHKQELAERFAGQWICIENEEVVECAATEGELLNRLNNTGPRPDSRIVCVRSDDGMAFIGSVH